MTQDIWQTMSSTSWKSWRFQFTTVAAKVTKPTTWWVNTQEFMPELKIFILCTFCSCSAHLSILIGICAANCCVNAISFFGFVLNLYNFFAVSTHRSKLLTNSLRQSFVVLKTLSNTRLLARCDPVRTLRTSYRQINSESQNILNDNIETGSGVTDGGEGVRVAPPWWAKCKKWSPC